MGEFAFINVSHPGDVCSRGVQGAIRRHVMKDIGRSRRKRPRAHVIPLQIRTPSPNASQDAGSESRQDAVEAVLPGEIVSLGPAWSLNPSGILGIDLDDRILQIIHYIKGHREQEYRPFMTIWIRMGLSDSTAFYLSLASALIFWDQTNGIMNREFSDNPEAEKFYFKALGQLSTRIGDPGQCISAGVIASILGCLCHDINVCNWKRWALHADGLDRIVKLRGGLDGLENDIPLMALWMELVGRTVFDEPPRFAVPQELAVPIVQAGLLTIPSHLLDLAADPQMQPIALALNMMFSIADTVNRGGNITGFWENELAAIQMIGPVTHHLLTAGRVPGPIATMPGCLLVSESARLACLILLSCLKTRFYLDASDMMPLQAKLEDVLMRETGVLSMPLARLRLWALVTAAMALSKDRRTLLVLHICAAMRDQSLADGRAAIDSAKQLIWIETIITNDDILLIEEVDTVVGHDM